MKYYARAISKRIKNALEISPVVFINGPRQAGKSTLVRTIAKDYSSMGYVTFDDITTRANASTDPQGFLRSFLNPIIIDEVQKVPEIFETLKLLVDEYRLQDKSSANGRFLLTGSVDAMAFPKLSEALVGRMIPISLYPLSASEIFAGGNPVINGFFAQRIAFNQKNEDQKPTLSEAIYKTSFPEITKMSKDNRHEWFNGYINTLFERDVRELAQIEKITALPGLLKVLAASVGSQLKNTTLAQLTELNHMTCIRYKALFEKLFLIKQVSPWYKSVGHRVAKAHKTFFIDTSLLCHQLGVDLEELKQNNTTLFGHVLENFVFSELQKQLSLIIDAGLYFFRTYDDKEVDFIIERRDGAVIGIEVKSKDSVDNRDFDNLKKLKDKIGKDFVRGIVLYCGKNTMCFADDMVAMPIDALWNLNMSIEFEEIGTNNEGNKVIIWAKYGDHTYIRCDIERDVISDYFYNNPASREEMINAVKSHRDVIEPIFIRKITEGLIYNKVDPELISELRYDLGDNFISGRYHAVLRVKLFPGDFDYMDFRAQQQSN